MRRAVSIALILLTFVVVVGNSYANALPPGLVTAVFPDQDKVSIDQKTYRITPETLIERNSNFGYQLSIADLKVGQRVFFEILTKDAYDFVLKSIVIRDGL